MQKDTCCFTGHRILPSAKMDSILWRLEEEIERLIQNGVTTFISGGALGFDQIALLAIAAKKEMGYRIRLELALPCHAQELKWSEQQKELYRFSLTCADEINYISEIYTKECMKKRNFYMVDRSAYCICALLKTRSGTGQTVRYAQRQKIQIINVAT